MISDQSRVQNSAAISFGVHGAAVGAFLLMRVLHPAEKQIALTHVEFIDLKPVQEAPAEPAPRQAPKSAMDFLRMALPRFPRPAATEMKDVATPQERSAMQLAEMPKALNLNDKPMLRSAPSIDLNDKAAARSPASANLADMAVRGSPRASDLAAPQEAPKAIDLDAVGRRAVRTAAPSINIDPNARPGRSTAGMAELAAVRRAAPAGGAPSAGMQDGGISLKDSGIVRRGPMPAGGPAYGYGKGGGGISLAERPMGRPAGAVQLAAPAKKPAPAEAKAAEVSIKNKGLEISGPLAGRKVLSASMPSYPEWARAKGVEADVVIRFFVDRDGRVQERMIVERTSGYQELDDLSMEALKTFVFAPLSGGSQEDQWGIVTFRFRLR